MFLYSFVKSLSEGKVPKVLWDRGTSPRRKDLKTDPVSCPWSRRHFEKNYDVMIFPELVMSRTACYLHLYMACFLTNCLQNARNVASDNPFFSEFPGGKYPQTPLRARACGSRHFAPEALIRPPPPPPPPPNKSWKFANRSVYLTSSDIESLAGLLNFNFRIL